MAALARAGRGPRRAPGEAVRRGRPTGSDRRVLLVLQGMDTSGKGGTLEHTVGLMDPQGVRITSFKAPTKEELSHDFLWRIEKALPQGGYVGVFDRSHYEDVLIVRVRSLAPAEEVERRYGAINEFEERLVAEGTTIIKCMLHISAAEQKERLLGPAGRPHQALEVQPGRPRRARAVAGLPRGLRDRAGADQHRARAVARHPRRQEVVPQPGDRQPAPPHPDRARPAVAGGRLRRGRAAAAAGEREARLVSASAK